MSIYFSKTLRSLQRQSTRPHAFVLVSLSAVAVAWAVWLIYGSVTLYAVSQSARIETDQVAHAVEPSVNGVISTATLRLGQSVQVGDVLLVLDSASEQILLDQEKAQLENDRKLILTVDRELDAQQDALKRYEVAMNTAGNSARARLQAASLLAATTQRQDSIIQQLRNNQLATTIDALKSSSDAAQQRAAAVTAQFEIQEVLAAKATELSNTAVSLARLLRDKTTIEGQVQQAETSIRQHEYNIERCTVRSPVNGVVADVTPVTVGTMVTAGQKLASIVPPGHVRMVAAFSPADAVGLIHQTQVGAARLDGFPWIEYGTVPLRVSQVASEARDGSVRVELQIDGPVPLIALSHGLTGAVEVEVEHVSPLWLLLRSIGQLQQTNLAPPSVIPTPMSSSASR